jgi:hypothetical protein
MSAAFIVGALMAFMTIETPAELKPILPMMPASVTTLIWGEPSFGLRCKMMIDFVMAVFQSQFWQMNWRTGASASQGSSGHAHLFASRLLAERGAAVHRMREGDSVGPALSVSADRDLQALL